jgi:hypothetical protein
VGAGTCIDGAGHAQSAVSFATVTEPAVIEHEALNSEAARSRSSIRLSFAVEIYRFPGVEHHGLHTRRHAAITTAATGGRYR